MKNTDMKTDDGLISQWAKSVLSNDEYSSDEELIEYFMTEGPMMEDKAKMLVAKRSFYLNNIVMDDGTVFNPHTRGFQTEAVIK